MGRKTVPVPPVTTTVTVKPKQLYMDSDEDILYVVSDYTIGANTLPGIAYINISSDVIKYEDTYSEYVLSNNTMFQHAGR